MSSVNVARPDAPGYDELVPSRYALKVGDIDVMVISDGVLPIPAVTLATNAATADLAAWLRDMFLPPEMLDWPLNVAVVRSGGRTILIDSGLGSTWRPPRPSSGKRPTSPVPRCRHRCRTCFERPPRGSWTCTEAS